MLVIGLGNTDRGDDAAGLLVARRLREAGADAIQHTGTIADLLDMWQSADDVLIVDTVTSGDVPGSVHVWDARTAEFETEIFRSSTHSFGLGELLKLAGALGRLPNHITVYGIEGSQFALGAKPSAQVLAGIERAIEQILSFERYSPSLPFDE